MALTEIELRPMHVYTSEEYCKIHDCIAKFKKPGIFVVVVGGHSMKPTLQDGAIVWVDTNQTEIQSGQIYNVQSPYNGRSLIKRAFIEGKRVMLTSDNPDKEKYPPFPLEDGRVLGRVIRCTQEL